MKRFYKPFVAVVLLLAMLCSLTGCCDEPAAYVDETMHRYGEPGFGRSVEQAYTMKELIVEAPLIVEADVEKIIEGENRDFVRLSVRTVLKGTAEKVIDVQDTGTVPREYLLLEGFTQEEMENADLNIVKHEKVEYGDPLMRSGHRVVLFLTEPTEQGYYQIFGDLGGKFFYDKDGTYHNCILYCDDFEEHKQRAEEGKLLVLPGYLSFDELEPLTLRDFRKLVKTYT